MKINEQLKEIYVPYLENLKIISRQHADKFSYPLLMKAFPEYDKVKTKILFVGKETYSWYDTMKNSEDLTVDYLMKCYEEFELGNNYYNSPFWRFIRIFNSTVNSKEYPKGFLWTNFSKCDSDGTTPSYDLQKLNEKGFDLLKDEIRIIKPDVIIFVTGWDYEYEFQRVFAGLTYETIEENYIYKCIHEFFPDKTFMTMHPNGLNFRGKFNSTLETITALLS